MTSEYSERITRRMMVSAQLVGHLNALALLGELDYLSAKKREMLAGLIAEYNSTFRLEDQLSVENDMAVQRSLLGNPRINRSFDKEWRTE